MSGILDLAGYFDKLLNPPLPDPVPLTRPERRTLRRRLSRTLGEHNRATRMTYGQEWCDHYKLAVELRRAKRPLTKTDQARWKAASMKLIGKASGDYIRSRLSEQGFARRILKTEVVT